MVIRVSDKTQNYSKVTKLLVKPYFLRNNEIRNIYLHLDNDEAGKNTTTKIKHVLKKKYKIYDRTPKHGKDVNDELIQYIQKEKEIKKWN